MNGGIAKSYPYTKPKVVSRTRIITEVLPCWPTYTKCIQILFVESFKYRATSSLYSQTLNMTSAHKYQQKTAIQDLTYKLKSCISSKTPFYVCFVYFEKAFDCVSRKKLMLKLSRLGCPSQILAVLTDIYKDTQIQEGLGDSLTRKIKQTRGVPQGDRLSPLLFSIFLADLSNYLENAHCTVIFYADDLELGSNNPQKLQNSIKNLSLFYDHNDISVNIEKTVVKVFQNAGRNRQIDVFYRKVTLTYTKCFVYLGLALCTRLSSYLQIEQNMKNLRKNFGVLNKTTRIRKFDFESASRLLKSVFDPIGFYGLDCLNDISDDKLSDQSSKISGTFYKYWASLPLYSSNHHLTDLNENSDPLSIKTGPIGTRKLIGLLYSDALHNKLCCTTKSFRQPKPTQRTPKPLPAHTNCVLTTYHRFPNHMYSFPPKHPQWKK